MFGIYAYVIYLCTKGHAKKIWGVMNRKILRSPDFRHAMPTERTTKLRKKRYGYHCMTYDLGRTQFPKWAVGVPQGKWEDMPHVPLIEVK